MTSVVQREPPHTHSIRGDAGMKKTVVKTYQIGKTTIRICSDHFAKTEEEKQKIIHEMHMAGWAIIREMNERMKEK